MDIQHGKITFWLAISIILLSTGLISHVMAIPVILNVAGRDSWLSVIVAAPIFIGWLVLYVWMINTFKGQSYLDWIRTHWGKFASSMMKLIFAAILFFNATYTLLDTIIWSVTTYLPETPFYVLSILTIILCIMMAYNGLQSIAIVASIMLPVVIFLGYLVAFTNTKLKDWSLLLPMLEQGVVPVLHGGMYVVSTLMDFWIILLFSHRMKKKVTTWQSVLIAIFLLMLVFGPITGAITEFGPTEATRQRHTAFEQWKLFSIGQFLQHMDFLSIYQWLSGAITRIAISLFLLMDLFRFQTKKGRRRFLLTVGVVMFAIALNYWDYDALLNVLQKYYFPYMLGFILLLTLSMGITILFVRRKEKMQHEQ